VRAQARQPFAAGASAAAVWAAGSQPRLAPFHSSPSPAMTAITSLTGTSCVPSAPNLRDRALVDRLDLHVATCRSRSPDHSPIDLVAPLLDHFARCLFHRGRNQHQNMIGIVSDPVATAAGAASRSAADFASNMSDKCAPAFFLV